VKHDAYLQKTTNLGIFAQGWRFYPTEQPISQEEKK
jgi:hypothetical protein